MSSKNIFFKPILLLIILFLFQSNIFAAIFEIGPTKTYANPNSLFNADVLSDGDTIQIDGGSYYGNDVLAVWSFNNLLIQGKNGTPKLYADGKYIWGKGIWVLSGNNITVENIAFFDASVPDKNGAGIRLDGSGLTVRNCYFKNNENSILTNNTYDGTILIEHSEFEGGGFGDGFSHNLYIGHCEKLIFQYNYVHHANVGHNLKSRAQYNIILYNRIMDEETGNSSRLIDIPNGGFTLLMGNLIMQGPESPNYNLIGFGLEGLTNAFIHHFIAVNNTILNKRGTDCLFFDIPLGTEYVDISNNIIGGKGELVKGEIGINEGNVINEDLTLFNFTDEETYDYTINEGSIAVNGGVEKEPINGYNLTPDKIYIHPKNYATRNNDTNIDAGAYEKLIPSITYENQQKRVQVFPNPSINEIRIESEESINQISIYDLRGQIILNTSNKVIDISFVNPQMMIVEITLQNGNIIYKKIIKG